MKATEDFYLTVLHAHVLAAARTLLSNSSNLHTTMSLAEEIVHSFIDIDIASPQTPSGDSVHEYAREMLSLLMIWHNFHDCSKEGDRDRLLLVWKLLLLLYRGSSHHNYAKEAATLLLQKHSLFSERKAAQLTWGRFVNVQGSKGQNIPTDLHMEHLNKRLKGMLRQSGSNIIKPTTIVRSAKAIGFVHRVCCVFESECGVASQSGRQKKVSFEKDLSLMTQSLEEENVFSVDNKVKRCHPTFPIKIGLIPKLKKDNILDWITNNIVPSLIFT